MIPPWPLRRLILAPLVMALGAGLIVLSPVLALLTILLRVLGLVQPGRLRWLRLLWLALIWFGGETAALVVSLGLWIASGFGGRMETKQYQARHYGLLRWFLGLVYGAAERVCGLQVTVRGPDDDPETDGEPAAANGEPAAARPPLIVLSRHAGPGDSPLLVHYLLNVCHRRPRIVMKASLQLDPGLDVVTNRLPNVFIGRKAGAGIFTEQISRLASSLGDDDALVIFPEGGNWTPGRWRHGIRRLRRSGSADLSRRAAAMPHLLPPRPGGVLAATKACPAADVVFVAHTGLDQFASVADMWRNLPSGISVSAQCWRVPADEVPRDADRDTQLDWLFGWWEKMNEWIATNRDDIPEPETTLK
ncbi:MAG: 1-acyl-sn-glycerol-3-phosphate acyltransferase [Streptosporangiaceae bacterium]|jgi:1-acyl-sn-glycerol-3-phosphate acyltransferase